LALTGVALASAWSSGTASAAVLDFEDIAVADPEWEEEVLSYGGFTWGNTYVVDGPGYGPGTGYENAPVSGSNVALNGWGEVSTTAAGNPFTFNGAYFTSAFRDDMTLTIEGYRDGSAVSSVTTTINTGASSWVAANFENIDALRFSTLGGTVVLDHSLFEEGLQFAMDNFTFNEPVAATEVPELDPKGATPALLLLAGAIALMFDRRARGAVA
jgi:hypothetical protein